MGNAEAKALTQDSPVLSAAIHHAHQQFLTYGRDYALDRSSFGLLFDTSRISFQLIDQLFEACDVDCSGGIDFAELAVGLVAGCSGLTLTEKLDILFDAIDVNGDGELTQEEVQATLAKFLIGVVRRIRGLEKSDGRIQYADRRCNGCREIPVNLVYECLQCNRGTALGIPITVHLCKNCVHSWEGYGLGSHDMLHTKDHAMKKSFGAHNPHIATHPGVSCSVCDMLPIVGKRYRCKQCLDFVNLCEACYLDGEEPQAHKLSHDMEVLEKASTLQDEVQRLIADLFNSSDANSDGLITRPEFHYWGTHSEVASALLQGFDVRYVKFCSDLELCLVKESTATNVTGK